MRDVEVTKVFEAKETTVGFENSSEAATWELQLRDRTSRVIALDTVEIVATVATVGFELVLELHESPDLVGTTSKSSDH